MFLIPQRNMLYRRLPFLFFASVRFGLGLRLDLLAGKIFFVCGSDGCLFFGFCFVRAVVSGCV